MKNLVLIIGLLLFGIDAYSEGLIVTIRLNTTYVQNGRFSEEDVYEVIERINRGDIEIDGCLGDQLVDRVKVQRNKATYKVSCEPDPDYRPRNYRTVRDDD